MDLKENDAESIKDYIVNYLLESGFVNALCKKSMFPSDIDNLYDDYVSECWLAILEQKPETWVKIYNSAKEKNHSLEYEARNYFSRVILNTVISDSSNAYRRLKKGSRCEKTQDNVKWDVLKNTIPEPKTIIEQIYEV